MTERSLQVTYRKGRAFSAYLHLAHGPGEKRITMMASPDGLLVVDYLATGRAVGIELTAPHSMTLDRLNHVLRGLREAPMDEQDYKAMLRE